MNTVRFDKEDLEQAVAVLRNGGVIIYPTDTIWGLGCDATNEEAVSRIYQIKQREDSKAMLVLLDGAGKLQGYVDKVPESAWILLEASEGQRPLTIIYPNAKNIAPNLIAEDGSVGIRITEEVFSKALCERLHRPIVSTSVNISGQKAAAIFSEIPAQIKQQADYICKYRRNDNTRKQASSIIKIDRNNSITIIRA